MVDNAESIWFEVHSRYASLMDKQSVDAFFILYVWLAMEKGVNLRVEGTVSRRLAESVTTEVKDYFLTLCPELHDVEIIVEKKCSAWTNEEATSATGFSGGVDSWYTALAAEESNKPYDFFLFANTGQHGIVNVDEVFRRRAELAEHIVRTLNKPMLSVNTNIDQVFSQPFQQRDVLGNVACVMCLQNGISQYDYSSTYAAEDAGIKQHYDMSIMDPWLLPALATERVQFHSVGDTETRLEKLRFIAAAEHFSKELYVCIEKNLPVKNCGECFKCRRTQIALECLGETELLANSFDAASYRRIRGASILGIFSLEKTSVLDAEVARQLIDTYGVQIVHLRWFGKVWSQVRKRLPDCVGWRIEKKAPYLW